MTYRMSGEVGEHRSKKAPQKKKKQQKAPITAATIVAKRGIKGAVKGSAKKY